MAGTKEVTVNDFIATLKHPHKDAIELLREVVLGADKSISDEVKWNAPSYRTTESFATTHLRAKTGVGMILHFGAKKRAIAPREAIADPSGLLQWLADDRAMVSFADIADVKGRRAAFTALVREWIRFV